MYKFRAKNKKRAPPDMVNKLDIMLLCPLGHVIGKVWDFTKREWALDIETTCDRCGQHYPLSVLTKKK